jgi:23S rRNA (uracil1939-C5)-methyltransferase
VVTASPVPVDVSIRGIAAGGAGVGRLPSGKTVFAHRTAPGDVARVSVSREKPTWSQARLVEIVEPGPDRVTPPCPRYDLCGGCTLAHLTYEAQLSWKSRIVRDALQRIAGLDVPLPNAEASPARLQYRNRVTFTLRRLRSGRVVAGFHELLAPKRVLDVGPECLLPTAPLTQVWSGLRAAWGGGARRLPAGGELRLTLREATQGVILGVRGGRGSGDPEGLLRDTEGLVAIWHEASSGQSILLAGLRETTDVWCGETIPVGPKAFRQVNRLAAEGLHRRVLEMAGAAAGRAIDAYCGTGVFGRALAVRGWRVTGIERDPEACAAARLDAPEALKVREGPVEVLLHEALPASLVILNPPRAGLHERVPEVLGQTPPDRLIYVSCDPATLARDLARLAPSFSVSSVDVFDLFPQTAHVEAAASLTRRKDG